MDLPIGCLFPDCQQHTGPGRSPGHVEPEARQGLFKADTRIGGSRVRSAHREPNGLFKNIHGMSSTLMLELYSAAFQDLHFIRWARIRAFP